jgi:hypothetical protein
VYDDIEVTDIANGSDNKNSCSANGCDDICRRGDICSRCAAVVVWVED